MHANLGGALTVICNYSIYSSLAICMRRFSRRVRESVHSIPHPARKGIRTELHVFHSYIAMHVLEEFDTTELIAIAIYISYCL